MKEPLYFLTVETVQNRQQLIAITGSRDTVLDAALRVILDAAPSWQELRVRPTFTITAQAIR